MPNGQLLSTLSPDHTGVRRVIFSPNGQFFASWSRYRNFGSHFLSSDIKIWQVPNGQLLSTLPSRHNENLRVAFSPDSQFLVSGSKMTEPQTNNTIQIWQMPNGQLLSTLYPERTSFYTHTRRVVFSPNGQFLVSYRDKTIKIWQVPNGQLLSTLYPGHTGDLRVAFSPDGQFLVSWSEKDDKTIKIWQVPNGQLLSTLYPGHTSDLRVAFSADGQFLISWDHKKIKVWISDLPRFSCLPIKQLCKENRKWVKKTLENDKITQEEEYWLEFMQALMDWHQRFDVQVEDAPQLVSTAEFDIEIEG